MSARLESAGAADLGLGTHFADVPLNPTFWVYFDYASGNHNPGQGGFGTFNQLFPNGHAYFGGTDLVGLHDRHETGLCHYKAPDVDDPGYPTEVLHRRRRYCPSEDAPAWSRP